MNPELSISSIVTTSICPIRFSLGKTATGSESPHYTVAKQISSHLGDEIDRDEIWEEISLIQKEETPGIREYFEECLQTCTRNPTWRRCSDSDVKVYSRNYRIHGIVDKVFDEEPYFSIVRSSRAPPAGIYTADRIRVAAYATCLQEMLGREIAAGCVEYIPSGIIRVCRIEPLDQRRFFRALTEATRILHGGVPKRPLRPPCETCPHKGHCSPEDGIRLSDLL